MEATYLGVVLTDGLFCAKGVERAKMALFEQFKSIYHKFNFSDKNVVLHLFRLHAMSFYDAEIWCMKLDKKYLKSISVPYHEAFKFICRRKAKGASVKGVSRRLQHSYLGFNCASRLTVQFKEVRYDPSQCATGACSIIFNSVFLVI